MHSPFTFDGWCLKLKNGEITYSRAEKPKTVHSKSELIHIKRFSCTYYGCQSLYEGQGPDLAPAPSQSQHSTFAFSEGMAKR